MLYDKNVKTVQHEIRSAYPVKDFHLILEFDDGEYRVVDLRPFLNGPVFEPLKDFSHFVLPTYAS